MPPEEVESLLRSNRASSDEKEVKELLRIDVKTVYSYAQRGLLPYVKIQSNLRFVKREIVKRMKELQFKPGSNCSQTQLI